jgi:hypothetical protein
LYCRPIVRFLVVPLLYKPLNFRGPMRLAVPHKQKEAEWQN